MSRIEHLKGFSIVKDGVNISIDLERFGVQLEEAQLQLDRNVMNSMERFMPKQTGTFINRTRGESEAMAGTGQVVAGAGPMGLFLYEGKTMVDSLTGSPWARKDAKKVLVSEFSGETKANPDLTFSQHANPNAQPEWFEEAKRQDGKKWIDDAKKTGGGGLNG